MSHQKLVRLLFLMWIEVLTLNPPSSNIPTKAHPKGIPPPSSSPTPLHLPKIFTNDLPPQTLMLNREPP